MPKDPDRMEAGSGGPRRQRWTWILGAFLFVFSVTLHIRAIRAPFLEFDDQYFIMTDQAIRSLDRQNLSVIFSEPFFANYHPLTRLSFAFDYWLFGGFHAAGFHVTSLVLYGLGCVLVFLFLTKLLDHLFAAFLASMLFAAHTTHVEVVAWLSARKDLLCLLFGALALLAFLKLRERERIRPLLYGSLLLCCLCAGLSKSLAVVLPLLFLALDLVWFRRRKWTAYWDLVPVLLIMVFVGYMNMEAQDEAGAIKEGMLPMTQVLPGVTRISLDYLWKTVLPLNLSARYVLYIEEIRISLALLGALLLLGLALTAAILFFRKKRLFPLAFAWFVIPLLPVSQILFPLSTPMADRYLLWPSLAWCLLVGGWLTRLFRRSSSGKARPLRVKIAAGTCAALILFYSGMTAVRCEVWLDDEKLWKDALQENPRNYIALNSLSSLALKEGRIQEARAYLETASKAVGGSEPSIDLNYGRILMMEGKKEEALKHFQSAYDLGGDKWWFAHKAADNIGIVLSALGRGKEAESWHRKALNLAVRTQEPLVDIRLNLGKAYFDTGRFNEAAACYQTACDEAKKDPRPRFYLGLARLEQGLYRRAVSDFEAALKLEEVPPEARFNYGDIHLMLGKVYQEILIRNDLALIHYKKTIELEPNHPQLEALKAVIQQLSEKQRNPE